jgi:hypothetical protein
MFPSACSFIVLVFTVFHYYTNGNMQSVTTRKENSSEAESFKDMKIKYATHLKMAM